MDRKAWTDARVEGIVGQLLISGVLLSAAVVAIGGVLFLLHHGSAPPHYHFFEGEPQELRGVAGILAGAAHLEGSAVIQLGLLLLIATPVVRVMFTVVAFAIE